MESLEGKVVCITGASRGLGAALARAFADQGAHLVLGSRDYPALEELAAKLPSAIVLPCDVSDTRDVAGLVDAAVAQFERLDVMVNNAGVAFFGPVLDTGEMEFDRMVATNLKGTFFGSKYALAAMKERHDGLIVNISSIAGRRHKVDEAAYAATKWAVQGLTGVLRLEAAQYNVRVTCVVPGGMDTPMWKEMDYLPFPPEVEPARDFMSPEDVASMVVEVVRRSGTLLCPEVVCVPTATRPGS